MIGPRPTLGYQVERYTRANAGVSMSTRADRLGSDPRPRAVPWEYRIELDVWYVEHRSLRSTSDPARTPLALFSGMYKGSQRGAGAPSSGYRLRP